MDKEQQIAEMAELIRKENYRMFEYHDGYIRSPHDIATQLIMEEGYSNTSQSQIDILQELKETIRKEDIEIIPAYMKAIVISHIDEIVKRLLGVKQNG